MVRVISMYLSGMTIYNYVYPPQINLKDKDKEFILWDIKTY